MQVITEREAQESFEDFLWESEGPVKVCGFEYSPARVLEEVDPVAYRQEFLVYTDWLVECDTYVEGYTDDQCQDLDESMDGDFDSGMASAGFGTDESYGSFGGDE